PSWGGPRALRRRSPGSGRLIPPPRHASAGVPTRPPFRLAYSYIVRCAVSSAGAFLGLAAVVRTRGTKKYVHVGRVRRRAASVFRGHGAVRPLDSRGVGRT